MDRVESERTMDSVISGFCIIFKSTIFSASVHFYYASKHQVVTQKDRGTQKKQDEQKNYFTNKSSLSKMVHNIPCKHPEVFKRNLHKVSVCPGFPHSDPNSNTGRKSAP